MSAVLKLENKSEEIISYNPANGEEIGRVAAASTEEVKAAVEKSRAAFTAWRETSFTARKRFIMKAREVILGEMDEIARLISDESGKPVAEALSMEIAPVLDLMQYFARNAEKLLRARKSTSVSTQRSEEARKSSTSRSAWSQLFRRGIIRFRFRSAKRRWL